MLERKVCSLTKRNGNDIIILRTVAALIGFAA